MGIEKQRNFQFTTNIPLLDRTFTNLKHTTILIRVMLRAEEGKKRSDKFSIYLCISNFKKCENNLQNEVNTFRMGQLPSKNLFHKTL